jgi:isomerase DpgB
MNTDHQLGMLASGHGFELDVDAACPLPELTASLTALCERAEDRDDASTVVLIRLGGPPPESRSWPGNVGIQDVTRWERVVRRMQGLAAMNIAAASGVCSGPALDLLVAADFRICAPDMRLLLPVNDGHLWPGMSVYWLVHQVGLTSARQIVLWGDEISADRAKELGLIDQVAEDLPGAVHTATTLMGRIADADLAIRRQLLNEATSVSFEDALGAHLAACDRELRRLRQAGQEH